MQMVRDSLANENSWTAVDYNETCQQMVCNSVTVGPNNHEDSTRLTPVLGWVPAVRDACGRVVVGRDGFLAACRAIACMTANATFSGSSNFE